MADAAFVVRFAMALLADQWPRAEIRNGALVDAYECSFLQGPDAAGERKARYDEVAVRRDVAAMRGGVAF